MRGKLKKHLINTLLMLLILFLSFVISIFLKAMLTVDEHITTVFVVGVFLVSLVTDGYLYGILSTFIAVLAINYAFSLPYLYFDFTTPENLLSALVMLVISLITSTLTTRLKKWQHLREESEREMMRAALLRAVSHDLRTPLTTIYGASSTILDNYASLTDEQKKKMVSGVREDSEWLIRMVENLLSVTRFDSGAVKLIKTPTVLEELIDAVLLKFKKRHPAQAITVELPDDVAILPMDAMLIEQVLINILENAIQHAKGMTCIALRVFLIDKKAIFEIRDDGCGIARERLESIFRGSYTSDVHASDSQKRGFGIGLSVCAAIVKAHGGDITAENAKDGGAIFRFALATEEDTNDQ